MRPASILDISRMSLIRARRCSPLRLMVPRYWYCRGLRSWSRSISWENPRMAFMGVRISCDMLARKTLLARLAASATSLAFATSSSERPLRHVLHRQNEQFPVMARLKLAGVEQHHPASDDREGVLELEVVEDGTLGHNILEQCPQVGDVPLAVAQFVNQAVLGFRGRDVKGLIESSVGGPDAQGGVEDRQRLAHGVDDVLGVGFDILDQGFSCH